MDSGSAVTALSTSFYKSLREVGAPVGEIRATNRRLRGANGSRIDILGCSFCVVSFLGLQTEFPILVCDLSTDAIIGTDILGTTFDDALDNMTLIVGRLRSYGLQFKSTKCHLFQTSVPFLGHVVGREGLQCDPKIIEDVKSWPVPDCLKSVQQFLGFVGYYRRFISNFADMAEPLVSLTGKDVPFVW